MPFPTKSDPKLRSLLSQLGTGKSILITAHKDPDIDAIGSCLGLGLILQSMGHMTQIWLQDPLPETAKHLPQSHTIHPTLDANIKPDYIFALDCSNFQRIRGGENLETLLRNNPSTPLINIDHHADNPSFGQINWVMERASSVGEMIGILFLEDIPTPISPDAATCLYAAIVFDTGRFLFSNTTEKTFQMASQLLAAGASFQMVNQAMFEGYSLDDFKLMKQALEGLVIHPSNRYAYTIIPLSQDQPSVKAIDVIRPLGGVSVFIAFTQTKSNEIKVSLRSKDHTNVQEIAAQFGGGGHKKASGITLNGSLEEVVKSVLAGVETALLDL